MNEKMTSLTSYGNDSFLSAGIAKRHASARYQSVDVEARAVFHSVFTNNNGVGMKLIFQVPSK